MRIVKLQRGTMICRSNFTDPLRLGLWLVACVGSCLVSRWSPGALAALGQESGCFDALFAVGIVLPDVARLLTYDRLRSTKRTKRVREADIEVARDQNLFLQSIWDQFQFQASLPSSPYPGHLETTAKRNSNLSVPPDPYWQQRWLCTDLVERSVRISTDRNTKKTLKTYKTQLAMMRHYYWCQDVGTHWRGVSRQKKFKSEYVSKHAIIYQSENGWESASWFLDKDSVDTAFLDIHVAQVCDGSLDIGSNTAWSLGIQLSDRVTRVTHNISGCLEHVQRE